MQPGGGRTQFKINSRSPLNCPPPLITCLLRPPARPPFPPAPPPIPAGEEALKQLDSSMKRNSALIRKLKALSEESRQSILDDIAKTNQSKVGRRGLAVVRRRAGLGWAGLGWAGLGWAGLTVLTLSALVDCAELFVLAA